MAMTLAEQMAMAVIKGDRVAAYALADLLIEERQNPRSLQEQAAARLTQLSHGLRTLDSYEVYQLPEFHAFCDRVGILYDLGTVAITFTIGREGEPFQVKQEYLPFAAPPEVNNG